MSETLYFGNKSIAGLSSLTVSTISASGNVSAVPNIYSVATTNYPISTAINPSGNTIVVGGLGPSNYGNVAVFKYSGSLWSGPTYIFSSGKSLDYYGYYSCAVNDTGNVIATGGYGYISGASVGNVAVFTYSGTSWSTTYLDDTIGKAGNGNFGKFVSINATGNVICVGSPGHLDGAAYGNVAVFTYSGTSWSTGVYLTQPSSVNDTSFGVSRISRDGNTILATAPNYNTNTGGAWVYKYSGSSWSSPVQLNGPGANSYFGVACGINNDGTVAAVSAYRYSSSLGWIGIYRYSGGVWSNPTVLTNPYSSGTPQLGGQVYLSGDGTVVSALGQSNVFVWKYYNGTWSPPILLNKLGYTSVGGGVYSGGSQISQSMTNDGSTFVTLEQDALANIMVYRNMYSISDVATLTAATIYGGNITGNIVGSNTISGTFTGNIIGNITLSAATSLFAGNVTTAQDVSALLYLNSKRIPAGSLQVQNYINGVVPLTTTTNLVQLGNAATIISNTSIGSVTQIASFPGTVSSNIIFQNASITAATANLATTNIFVEAWVNPSTTFSATGSILQRSNATTSDFSLALSSTLTPSFTVWNASATSFAGSNATALNAGSWYHIAGSYVQTGLTTGTVYVFSNGAPGATTGSLTTAQPSLSGLANVIIGSNPFTGNIADVRIWYGGVVPTAGFTPATAPFGTSQPSYITGTSNLYFSLQSQYFPGSSTAPYGPVLTLPGTIGSYYSQNTTAAHSNWASGFTLEAWVKYATFSNANTYVTGAPQMYSILTGQPASSGNNWTFGATTTGNVAFGWKTSSGTPLMNAFVTSNTITSGVWNHILVQSNGSNVFMAVNGVFSTLYAQGFTPTGGPGTSAPSIAPSTANTVASELTYPITVGQFNAAAGPNMSIARARLIYGANVYSAGNFTPNPNFASNTTAPFWQLESLYPLQTYQYIQDTPVRNLNYGSVPLITGNVSSNTSGPYTDTTLKSLAFDGTGIVNYGNSATSILNTNIWSNSWTMEGWVYQSGTTGSSWSMYNRSTDFSFGVQPQTPAIQFVYGSSNVTSPPLQTYAAVGATTLYGNSTNFIYSVATDKAGNVYIAGTYSSSITVPINNLGLSASGTQVSSGYVLPISTGQCSFVIKYNPSGTALGACVFDGTGTDSSFTVITDTSNNFYVAGTYTSSGTVPINNLGLSVSGTQVSSGYVLPAVSSSAAFILKYNTVGVVQSSWYLDGTGLERNSSYNMAFDSSGNLYTVGGYLSSGTVPLYNFGLSASGTLTASGYVLPSSATTSLYILKYNSSGVIQASCSMTIGGGGLGFTSSLATDTGSNVYIISTYTSAASNVTIYNWGLSASGTFTSSTYTLPTTPASGYPLLLKYNSTGTILASGVLATSTNMGIFPSTITTDIYNNVYIGGYYLAASTSIYNWGLSTTGTFAYSGYTLAPTGSGIYGAVLKYNTTGTFQGSTIIPCRNVPGQSWVFSLYSDTGGNIYVGGQYDSAALANNVYNIALSSTPVPSGYTVQPSYSNSCPFLFTYNSSGVLQNIDVILSQTNAGIYAGVYGITGDSSGNIYMGGVYNATTAITSINNPVLSNTQSPSGYYLPLTPSNQTSFLIKYQPPAYTTYSSNTWSHIASVYDSSNSSITIYLGGNQLISSAYVPSSVSYTPTLPFQIGNSFIGNFADLRISNVARYYGSTFIPPTTQLTNDSNTLLLVKNLSGQPGSNVYVQGRGIGSMSIGATSNRQTYPPVPMSSYSIDSTSNTSVTYGQGRYISTGSSEYVANTAWYAFDSNASTQWISGSASFSTATPNTYTGSMTTVDILGTVYSGEWVQLQTPMAIIPTSYSITPFQTTSAPALFWLLGSRDGVNWNAFDARSNVGWATTATQSFAVQTTQSYNYLRFVVNQVSGSASNVSIVALSFTGTEEALCVTNDSKLGLGVTAPQKTLEVAGDLVVGGTISGGLGTGMFRNRIINGDMRVSQRGLSSVISAGNSSQYLLDRFITYYGITTGGLTLYQNTLTVTDTPYMYGFRNAMNVVATVANTSFSNILPGQILEPLVVQDFNWGTPFGVPATLSFWFRTNAPTGSVFNYTVSNFSVGTYNYVGTFTVTSGTWQYYTFTIPPPPGVSSWSVGTSVFIGGYSTVGQTGLANQWNSTSNAYSIYGSYNWPSVYGSYIQFTGVQFEKGTVATPFDFRPYPTELGLCQRYYFTTSPGNPNGASIGNVASIAYTTSGLMVNCRFPVNMRTDPASISVYNNGVANQVRTTSTAGTVAITVSGSKQSAGGVAYITASATPFTAGLSYDFDLVVNAELS